MEDGPLLRVAAEGKTWGTESFQNGFCIFPMEAELVMERVGLFPCFTQGLSLPALEFAV